MIIVEKIMAANGQNNGDDDVLVGIVLLFALICAFVYFGFPFFQEFFLTIKLYQMEVIARVIPVETYQSLLYQLQQKPSYDWTFEEVARVGYLTNYYFLPAVLIVVFMGITYAKDNLYIIKRYNKIYSPQMLLEQETEIWQFLKPVEHLNLLQQDATKGPWASAKKPQEVAIEFKLLNNPRDMNSLNEEKAMKYFAMQLGGLYRGVEHLSKYEKALFGCFAAQYMERNDDCYFALMDISASFGKKANGKHDFEPGLALYEEYKDNPKVLRIMEKHAYITTALAHIFSAAGDKGIILTKYFIWLKPTDRKLYYMLNCIGREVPFVECGGIFDHYQHEIALKRPMVKLFVEKAVEGLKKELKNVKLREA